ncbi:hypothetical protein CJ197_08910 [Brachybacterium sp. UMB0905]|nr:hypothetical protein CJ197_08910 [Brachybacterium sp. UMB0905]
MVSRSARARGTGSYEATLPAPLAHADLTVPLELSAAVSDAGILQEATGRSRNRVWVQKDVLSILDTYAEQARRRA